jgi:hypothetical protein
METTGIEPASSWLQIERSSRNLIIARRYLEKAYEFCPAEASFPGFLKFYGEF